MPPSTTAWHKAVVTVNSAAIEFAFLDSGAVGGGAYRTLVFVHGKSYHSNVFSRLLPLAANNLRIIAVNRRDYAGSTPFSQSELDGLHCDDAGILKEFMRLRGLEIASFLAWVIHKLELPARDSTGRPSLSLIGWSLGNITTIAFLHHAPSYPPQLIQTLETYLGDFYVYGESANRSKTSADVEVKSLPTDFAYNGMGYESPPDAYHPLTSAKSHNEDTYIEFNKFVWTYYQHPSLRDRRLSGLLMKAPDGIQHLMSQFTSEEFAECTESAPGARSEIEFYPTHKAIVPVLRDQFKGAIILGSHSVLQEVSIRFLFCSATIWTVPWGHWAAEDEVNKWKHEGRSIRPVTFEMALGENHFFHFDHPIEFLKFFPASSV